MIVLYETIIHALGHISTQKTNVCGDFRIFFAYYFQFTLCYQTYMIALFNGPFHI